MKPYLVGITGGSAAGKTYLLYLLQRELPDGQITVISQDNYYHDKEHQTVDADGNINFDHPQAVNLELLHSHIAQLIEGKPISIREYQFNLEDEHEEPIIIHSHPAPIIVVEGLFVFYHRPLSKLLNLKVFLDVDEHIRLSRRIKRDAVERGLNLDSVLEQYEQFVVPMFRQYVQPARYQADIILNNNTFLNLMKGTELLIDHLKKHVDSI
jgi:uridine kinase